MTQELKIIMHDASELPPNKNDGSNHSELMIAQTDDGLYKVDVYYCYDVNSWQDQNLNSVTVLYWFEKPPVQKKKKPREVEVDVYRDAQGKCHSFERDINVDKTLYGYVTVGKLIFEE